MGTNSTVKFQHLTICRSRLYPEDTPISLIQDQIGLILGGFWAIVQANIVWRSSIFSTISSCSHAFAMKIPVFTETGRIQILHFSVQLWPHVTSWRWTKLKKVNIVAKNVSIVLSNQSNSRSYLLSSVMKNTISFCSIGLFFREKWVWGQRLGSQNQSYHRFFKWLALRANQYWNNFGRSSIQIPVIPVLLFFFFIFEPIFQLWAHF